MTKIMVTAQRVTQLKIELFFYFQFKFVSASFQMWLMHDGKWLESHRVQTTRLLSNVAFQFVPVLLATLWPLPPAHPNHQSHWFPSLLECGWFAILDLLSAPNRYVSHISHSAAMNPSGIAFPQTWTLSFITSTQKSSCWMPFLYAWHRAVFSCRAASLNSLFPPNMSHQAPLANSRATKL